MAGCMSVIIAVVIGVPLGLVAGYFQKMWDGVISRFIEALLACPFLIMAIALGAFLGPSLTNAMIAIGLSAMPIFARLTRGQVIAIRNEEYIDGARAIGLPDRWIIIKYVLPNVMSPIPCRPRLRLPRRLSPKPACRFWGWDSSRQIRPGAPCSTPRKGFWSRLRGCPFSPAWRFSLPCRALIYSATGCAMRSIRATTKES